MMILIIYIFIGSCVFPGRYIRFRLTGSKLKIRPNRIIPLFFDIFRTEGWNEQIYEFLELTRLYLQNDMHINDFCQISNFLIKLPN
jgi:hypothetical protein